MLLYSPHITNRLKYIVSTLLHDVVITDNKELIAVSNQCFINYSDERINNHELWIKPHGLLNKTSIKQQNIICGEWNGLKTFFATDGDIPFDIFSAAFYLLTRYEEYLPHDLDSYGRYAHTNSIAYKENFLHLPLIDLWLQQLNKQIPINNPKQTFTFIPTYDIDIAYAYQHHSILKNTAGFFKDFLRGDIDKTMERLNVYSGKKNDPFDVYFWLDEMHKKYGLSPIYFFLLAQKREKYDKNLPPASLGMKNLIKNHSARYQTGIHPSWQSGDSEEILAKEVENLSKLTNFPVTQSRQHYIRMQLPITYRSLIKLGIEYDYSMGYGSINGFRASYSQPFKWYDLENEQKTNLSIYPFCYMEANSFFEQKFTAEEAADELKQYYSIVKQVNGQFITVFHNHFLTEQPQWIAWRNMYQAFLSTI